MKACAQHLAGVIRVGPDCDAHGKPWEYACAYASSDGITCVLMAVKGDGGLTAAHVRAAVDAARNMGFKRIVWERYKPDSHRQIVASAPKPQGI